jgi:integrase
MANFYRRKKNGKPYGNWRIKYKDENGKWRTATGYSDKETTKTKARGLETDVERRRQGLVDPFEAPKKVSLADHLAAFERHLEAKGDCADHVARYKARIQSIFDGCGFGSIVALCAHDAVDKVNKYLATRTDLGKQTKNHYRTALISFCRWAEDGRMPATPLSRLRKVTITEKSRERRAISVEEIDKLLNAAWVGPKTHALTGEQRYWVYRLAIESGLRAGELASLTLASFSSDSVIVRASISKNHKIANQPLRPEFLEQLRPWLEQHDQDRRLWPSMWYRRAAEMLQVDLKAAGISYKTRDGVCDFHSLRAVYITELAEAGVDMKSMQTLARHSTPVLTMNVYAKARSETLAAAVAKLPSRAASTKRAPSAPNAHQTGDTLGH